MIGIIGYGMVGKAVEYGFPKIDKVISDPEYNSNTIEYLCSLNLEAIFVCVPTPTDDSNYKILKDVLDELKELYNGLVIVKSTILPHHLEGYNVVYNPEFLSRKTSLEDFVNPPMVILGGETTQVLKTLDIYEKYSIVDTKKVFTTDIKTASFIKYVLNTFYATKVTFMNAMYDVANEMGVDYTEAVSILEQHPYIGQQHLQVPGPDGARGYGGPCLPKDTEALAKEFDIELLHKIVYLNNLYRGK